MKKPGLNIDARAVLLVAQLPSAELPAAFILVSDDVRSAQFERGRARLREMGLLEGDTYNLTDEGIGLARTLQENEARLHAGIPYAERDEAIRMRSGKETAKVPDEWQPCRLDGQPAFTNGYILILGYPPSDTRLEKTFQPANIQKAWEAGGADAPIQVRPVAYSEQQGWKERKRTVWLSDGACVDAEAFTFIMQRAPGAIITHEATPNADRYSQRKVLNFYVEGHRVAMLMPYHQDAPEEAAKLIRAARSTSGETEEMVSAKPEAERLCRIGRFLYASIKGRIDAVDSDYRFYQFKDALAARVSPDADMLTTLWQQPEICLTWLLTCWTGLDEQVKVCTGRTRAEWIAEINGSQEVSEPHEGAQAAPREPEPFRVKPIVAATQLSLLREPRSGIERRRQGKNARGRSGTPFERNFTGGRGAGKERA